MILDFTDVQKNVGNEGKAGRFYILPMFKRPWKMNVKSKDFKFWKILINFKNKGKIGRL